MKIISNLFTALIVSTLSGIFVSTAAQAQDCDEACLIDIARQYMNEVMRENPSPIIMATLFSVKLT